MQKIELKFDQPEEIIDFVRIMNRYECDADVKYGSMVVDAKPRPVDKPAKIASSHDLPTWNTFRVLAMKLVAMLQFDMFHTIESPHKVEMPITAAELGLISAATAVSSAYHEAEKAIPTMSAF